MGISLYRTADESYTLYNEELDETYHSRNGALEESEYVFLQQGFEPMRQKRSRINLLEVGFGTGLNAFLTLVKSIETGTTCHYHSLETFPLPAEVIRELNYGNLAETAYQSFFQLLHDAPWNTAAKLTEEFTLCKTEKSMHRYQPAVAFDLVYFDAFGPDKQPDMWEPEVFERLYSWMNPGGIFVTYSSKGAVRRALQAAGFLVERLPGPPKKRHMVRAIKPE